MQWPPPSTVWFRASLDADALVLLQVREAASLRRSFDAAGFITELRIGDPDDPIPALLDLRDAHGNRVDLLIGLRGLDPQALSRAVAVGFLGGVLRIIGREDLIAMKVFPWYQERKTIAPSDL